jgi:hypothetical protein
LAGWATPAARDEKGIDQNFHDGAVNNSLPNQVASLSGWPTASCRDAKGRTGQASQEAQKAKGHERKILAETAELAGWATPQASDNVEGSRTAANSNQKCLGRDLSRALGPTSSSSPAGTERRGVLSPVLPCWMMGFPIQWIHYAPVKAKKKKKD